MDSKEIMSKNLNSLLKSKGIDQRILADYLGLSEMSVSNWVNGIKYPRMNNIQKMADYFGVKKSDIIEDKENKPYFTSSSYYYIPESISAGLPINMNGVENAETLSIPDAIMGKYAGDSSIVLSRINGDSMNRVIEDGSLIAVKPVALESLKNGDMVVFSDNYEYSVKYFYKHDDKLIFRPFSTNPAHYDQTYHVTDNIKIHGKVALFVAELD